MLFKHNNKEEYILTEDSQSRRPIHFYLVSETKTCTGYLTYFKQSIEGFPEDLEDNYDIVYDFYKEQVFHLLKYNTQPILNSELVVKQLRSLIVNKNIKETDLLPIIINYISSTKENTPIKLEDIISYQDSGVTWGYTGSTLNNINVGFTEGTIILEQDVN